MGITAVNEKVAAAFDDNSREKVFFHGHSYTANPIACAAACASFDILTSEETQEALSAIQNLHKGFAHGLEGHAKLSDIRQTGTILAMELNVSDGGYTSNIREKIYLHFLDKNMLMRPLGNIMYLLPPYIIKEKDLKRAYSEIEAFLEVV